MDTLYIDRRRVRPVREQEWKRQLTAAQADMLQVLEQVGWSLRFVRNDGGQPRAAVYDPDRRRFGIIEPDGRLDENPALAFRA